MDLHVLKGTHISAILAFLGFFPMMDIRVMDGRTRSTPRWLRYAYKPSVPLR